MRQVAPDGCVAPKRDMPTCALRGAIVVDENSEAAILAAAHQLLSEIVRANQLQPDDIISVLFTLTSDLDAAFPTRAARELGWTRAALLDAQQPRVQGDLARCLRTLIHCNLERGQDQVEHIYLGAARALRPDLHPD